MGDVGDPAVHPARVLLPKDAFEGDVASAELLAPRIVIAPA
jgi:hypothetical protein